MLKLVLFQLIFLYFGIATACAGNKEQSTINQFKSYLQTIKSIAVDFDQTDSNGTSSKGKLLISKPYKFRCNYYPPFPILIIGNKNYVSVYDYDMETVSRIKPKDNIFNFLLTDDTDFEQHFQVSSVTEQGRLLTVKLYHIISDRYSNITFNKDTQQLQKIEVFEDDNIITLKFDQMYKVSNFAEELFEFKNPDIFGPPDRMTKDELEKHIVLQQ
ncbi:Outer membrane lipocarrier LolA family protein [Candidatus Trichorickettsia mobilis]|uniref:Outer membrane lipocarrier LolA family protein n=1 Tax=Candidatus Trichorickettsia mobilis TaxID=1346319 RepID=A0ABZ0UVG7_9RICK|nr:outer-membrane lipoprotein carrier protein LolA [Candidatus Trichorickettsia mobilis]WPY01092.1 Outer membrane lipocarrier LolA family protein [Candidatus Trichorickettsia mobilis]